MAHQPITMSNICRFCLRADSSKMHLLTNETLDALNAHLSLQILIINSLPKQICDDCFNKTKKLLEFQKTVSENEKILHEFLTKGHDELNRYFISIQRPKIKDEDETSDFNGFTIHYNDNDNDPAISGDIKEESTEAINSSINYGESNIKEEITEPKDSNPHKDTQNTIKHGGFAVFNFKCLTCFELFDSQNVLLSHYKTGHYEKPDENDIKVTFNVESTGNGHIYKCNACSKVYQTKKSINRHIARGHSDARPFLCKMCGRTYKTASEIVRHGRAHNGAKLFCSHQCGYSTVYHGALKEHERRHNASEFKYKCEKCDKGFHVKTWYLQHQNIHTGLKPFVCDICGAAFHMDKYLTTHRSLKHPQSSNRKRFVCVHCTIPCDSRNALTEHLKEHGMKTEKKFLCDLCGKILSNAEQLRFHKRMHLGVKPYTCSTCSKSFSKKFNLQLHERSHSGEKDHECQRCGKRYGQRSTLLRHVARHHSDSDKLKPSKCVKAFSAPDQVATQKLLCT